MIHQNINQCKYILEMCDLSAINILVSQMDVVGKEQMCMFLMHVTYNVWRYLIEFCPDLDKSSAYIMGLSFLLGLVFTKFRKVMIILFNFYLFLRLIKEIVIKIVGRVIVYKMMTWLTAAAGSVTTFRFPFSSNIPSTSISRIWVLSSSLPVAMTVPYSTPEYVIVELVCVAVALNQNTQVLFEKVFIFLYLLECQPYQNEGNRTY